MPGVQSSWCGCSSGILWSSISGYEEGHHASNAENHNVQFLWCELHYNNSILCTTCNGVQEQCQKLRDERESAMKDLAVLRCDLDAGRAERDRLLAELKEAKDELEK